jgi:hypothetical protein
MQIDIACSMVRPGHDAVGFGVVLLVPLAIAEVGPCTKFLAKLSFLIFCVLFNELVPHCPCRLAGCSVWATTLWSATP